MSDIELHLIATLTEKVRELPPRRLKAVRWYLSEIRAAHKRYLLRRQRALERAQQEVSHSLEVLDAV